MLVLWQLQLQIKVYRLVISRWRSYHWIAYHFNWCIILYAKNVSTELAKNIWKKIKSCAVRTAHGKEKKHTQCEKKMINDWVCIRKLTYLICFDTCQHSKNKRNIMVQNNMLCIRCRIFSIIRSHICNWKWNAMHGMAHSVTMFGCLFTCLLLFEMVSHGSLCAAWAHMK